MKDESKPIRLKDGAIKELNALKLQDAYRSMSYSDIICILLDHEKVKKTDSDALLGDNERLLKINNTLEKEIEELKESKQRIIDTDTKVQSKEIEGQFKLDAEQERTRQAEIRANSNVDCEVLKSKTAITCQIIKSGSFQGKIDEVIKKPIALAINELEYNIFLCGDDREKRRLRKELETAEQYAMSKGIPPRKELAPGA